MATDRASAPGRHWRAAHKIGMLFGIGLGAAALGILTTRAFPHRPEPAGLDLVCEQADHDFGPVTLAQARRLEHIFRLANTGNQAIRITGVRTTCGCTAADYSKSVAGPGSYLEVPIKADWSAKAGPVEQSILVETSSLATPKLLLRIKGNVQVPVAVSPTTINLGALKSGEVATRRVRVGSGTATQPVAITSVTVSAADMSLVRTDEDGRLFPSEPLAGPVGEFVLRVQAPEATEPLRRDGSVTFRTDHPDVPSLALRVEFQVEPAIQASPGSMLFSRSEQGRYGPQRIKVTCPEGQVVTADLIWEGSGANPFRLRGPLQDDSRQDSSCFEVSFAPAEGNPGSCRARLVLKGDHHVRHIPIITF